MSTAVDAAAAPASAGRAERSRQALVAGVLALNVAVAFILAHGPAVVGIAIACVPVAGLVLTVVVLPHPRVLVYAALGLAMFGDRLNSQLPLPISTVVYPADILVGLAILAWLAGGRADRAAVRRLRTPVLGVPFLLLFLAIVIGVLRGHQSYGLSYFSQPIRIVVYAGIAAAVADLTLQRAYRAIVGIFYAGAAWQAILAVYYLATGGSQTESIDLSTGGRRVLALSTAMLLACSLVLALLNLDREWRARRRALHLSVAALAMFGIVVSLGRTTFAAVAVLVPVLVLALRRVRAALVSFVPLALPLIVVAALFIPRAAPHLGPTLTARLTGKVGNDTAVVTRQRKFDAALKGFDSNPVLGLGFGRPYSYLDLDRTVKTLTGDPEDSYVYLLAGGGIFALASWLLVGASFLWTVARGLRGAHEVGRVLLIWAAAAWFVLSVNMLTGPILSVPSLLLPLWIVLLLPAVALHEQRAARGPD